MPPRSEADRRGALRLGRARGRRRRHRHHCSLRTSTGYVLLHHIGAEMSRSMPTFSQRAENVLDLSAVAFDSLSCRGRVWNVARSSNKDVKLATLRQRSSCTAEVIQKSQRGRKKKKKESH